MGSRRPPSCRPRAAPCSAVRPALAEPPVRAVRPDVGPAPGRTDRAARPRSRPRIRERPPSGRRRPTRAGCSPHRPQQSTSPRDSARWIASSRQPREKWGSEALRRLRIEEDVRLVRALVDGRAAQLGEPDRLRLAAPTPSASALHPARTVVMRVRPPARPDPCSGRPRPRHAAPSMIGCAHLRRRGPRRWHSTSRSPRPRDVRLADSRGRRSTPALGVEHGRSRPASPTAACSCRCRRSRSPDAPTADRGGRTTSPDPSPGWCPKYSDQSAA